MKNKNSKCILATLLIVLSFPTNTSTSMANETSVYYSSSWASQKVAISVIAGITSEGFDTQPFNTSITRQDFCELLLNTAHTFGITLPEPSMSAPFSDTTNINAENAYLLGLTQGTATGIFSPDLPLTREMAAVMLSKMRILFQYTAGNNKRNEGTVTQSSTGQLSYSQPMDDRKADQTLSNYSTDGNLVSSWAKTSMADVYTRGILAGTGEGRLDPKSYITREQAVLLSLNVLSYCDETQLQNAGVTDCILPVPSGIYNSDSYYKGDVSLRWNEIPLATAYDVTVLKNGVPVYTTRTENTSLDLRTSSTTYNRDTKTYETSPIDNPLFHTIFGSDNSKIYATLIVVPVNSKGGLSVFSLKHEFTIQSWENKNEMIFGDPAKTSFATNEEALRFMTSVKVNIWKINSSGLKISSVLTLTVNKNLAEDVVKIFAEIYNGKEKFPIKNCGGYAFRNGTSEHTGGTAIDINYNENYFVSWEGAIKVGLLWQPFINQYSIPADGDVVRAFNKYGWHWSPDMKWPNGADYMHFSLGGR